MEINADFPPKLQPLFEPHRYKILHGGRGGAKSWSIARALLLQGLKRPLRVLCARELQNSMKDSVHKLLSDQIVKMGLESFYEVQRDSIKGINGCGTEFSFEGIKHNVQKIKSYEGVDVCWVEEAVSVSQSSWDVLIPTIRKAGSEIWMSFNPELETDETYKRFVLHTPSNAFVVQVSWRDNPWFEDVLRLEMEDLKARDYDAYLHVWEGHCRSMLDGAVYAGELKAAGEYKRILHVPYDHTKPVDTFWDLGYNDMMAIWLGQKVGYEWHMLKYIEDRQKHIDWYIQHLQKLGYTYGTDYLPHDAKAKSAGMKASVFEQFLGKGRKASVLPRLSVLAGINMAREVFPTVYFDSEGCADGLNSLRRYRYDTDPDTGMLSREPIHDRYSHCADAFRYFAVASGRPRKDRGVKPGAAARVKKFFEREETLGGQSWME